MRAALILILLTMKILNNLFFKKRLPKNLTPGSARGFTLIELLIALTIVAILSSVVMVSMDGARIKSRHAKRISDLKQLETAIILYANDHSYKYPSTSGNWYGIHACTAGNAKADWIPGLVSGGYITALPKEPRDSGGAVGCEVNTPQYLYRSDETDFKLIDYKLEDCAGFVRLEPSMADPVFGRDCLSATPAVGVWSSPTSAAW